MKSKTTLWLILLVVAVVIIFAAVFAYMILVPAKPAEIPGINNQTLSPADLMTQAALYNPTPQPNATFKPADKLIIKTVNFDKSGAISEIITFIPAAIADGQVTINGLPVESQKTQKDTTFTLSFLVPESARQKSVTFIIVKDGKPAATCAMANTDSLVVTGDCIF